MKILYITDPGSVGGATRSLVDVLLSMKARGVECVVCTSVWNELNEELSENGIQSFACGHYAAMEIKSNIRWRNGLRFLKYMALYWINRYSAIKKIEAAVDIKTFDLVHTNSARNDIGCLLNKKYGIPHIMHIREFGKEDFDCWTFMLNYERYISRYTTRFIAISKAVAKAWSKRGLDSDKVKVIYNGVSDSAIEKAAQIGVDDVLRLVTVGGVCEAKAQLHSVNALSHLPEEIRSHVTLDLIGWGDEMYIAKVQNAIQQLGLEKQVRLLGARKDVGCLLKNYDVGITSSRAEGFGRVTAEYMHAGLGVIVSDTGANPEIITHKENGLIYTYGNVKELASAIEKFYTDRSLLKFCARNAIKCAKENYTKMINAEKIYKEYVELLEGSN